MDDRREGVRTVSGSTTAIAGRGFVLSLFAGQINGVSHRAVDAAVVWRVPPPTRPRSRAGSAPKAPDAARRADARSANPFVALGGWSASGDGVAGRWVGFHKEQGIVRVDGHDYPVRSDDQTVVLLAATRDDGHVTVLSHVMRLSACPVLPRPSLRSALLVPAWAALRRRPVPPDPFEEWLQGITGDPVVAAFLASRAGPGAP